jgi:hypothetical protein
VQKKHLLLKLLNNRKGGNYMAETQFSAVYNRFLGQITDDLYLELTPEDTLKDLQNLLINAIPGFEFPRKNLYDYTIEVKEIPETDVTSDDFIVGVIWGDLDNTLGTPNVMVDKSRFNIELTAEVINIFALLMKQGWVQRQVTSIENTRMKYSGSDFKMTSQANHLSKLLTLLEESRRDSFHMQRLYKRRKLADGGYQSNWSSLMEVSAID